MGVLENLPLWLWIKVKIPYASMKMQTAVTSNINKCSTKWITAVWLYELVFQYSQLFSWLHMSHSTVVSGQSTPSSQKSNFILISWNMQETEPNILVFLTFWPFAKVKVNEICIKWQRSIMPISKSGMKEFGWKVSATCPKFLPGRKASWPGAQLITLIYLLPIWI